MGSDGRMEHLREPVSHRPIGIWVMTLLHVLFAGYWIFRLSPGLTEPLPHGWDEGSMPFARFALALYLGMIATIIGAWFGSAGFRYVFLVLLTVAMYFFVREDYLVIMFFLVRKEAHVELPFSTQLGLIANPLLPVAWLIVNYWYLLGRRTRSFYRKTRHPS